MTASRSAQYAPPRPAGNLFGMNSTASTNHTAAGTNTRAANYARAPRATLALRLAAAVLIAGTIALWAATGAHRGWTQTSKVVLQQDEITGIEFPVHQKTSVAGVEVLAAGVALSTALAAASLLTARRHATK